MKKLRSSLVTVGAWLLLALAQVMAQAPPGQTEFVPVSELPPAEQLPGGAFVIIAYSIIWVATIVYLWSIWRRLGKVEAEMRALERRRASGSSTR